MLRNGPDFFKAWHALPDPGASVHRAADAYSCRSQVWPRFRGKAL